MVKFDLTSRVADVQMFSANHMQKSLNHNWHPVKRSTLIPPGSPCDGFSWTDSAVLTSFLLGGSKWKASNYRAILNVKKKGKKKRLEAHYTASMIHSMKAPLTQRIYPLELTFIFSDTRLLWPWWRDWLFSHLCCDAKMSMFSCCKCISEVEDKKKKEREKKNPTSQEQLFQIRSLQYSAKSHKLPPSSSRELGTILCLL